MKTLLLVFLAALFVPIYALAQTETTVLEERPVIVRRGGLYVEPFLLVTRENGQIKSRGITGARNDNDATADGVGGGVRVGTHAVETLVVGFDGRCSQMELDSAAYRNSDGRLCSYGPVVVLQTPYRAGLKVFGSYVMGGDFNPSSDARGLDLRFKDPEGPRLGVGVKIENVGVNLEYQNIKYRRSYVESAGNLTAGLHSNADFISEGYALSLSFPFAL